MIIGVEDGTSCKPDAHTLHQIRAAVYSLKTYSICYGFQNAFFFDLPQTHEVLDMEDALELEKGLKPRGEKTINILFECKSKNTCLKTLTHLSH